MLKNFKLISVIFFIGIIYSCSPRYEIAYIYNPPSTEEGKKCVEKCKIERIKCNNICAKKRNRCYKEAIEVGKKIYKLKLEEYKVEYKDYLEKYRDYRNELWNWESRKRELENNYLYFSSLCATEKRFCSEKDFYYRLLREWEYKEPIKPEKPSKPNLSKIIEEQKQKLCRLNCNCTEEFNICFQNCGGKLEIKRICVEYCE